MVVDANKVSGDILYQDFERPITGGVAAAVAIARGPWYTSTVCFIFNISGYFVANILFYV